jgi:CBS domain-containing protein
MLVREVMTRGVETIAADSTLQDAAQKMKDLDVGPLPVCEGGRLVGMLTDRDITVRSTAEGLDPWTTKVREAMTPEVVSCFADQDVSEAARLMKEKKVRRLPVLDRDRRLVGILALGDLAGDALEDVSPPAGPRR